MMKFFGPKNKWRHFLVREYSIPICMIQMGRSLWHLNLLMHCAVTDVVVYLKWGRCSVDISMFLNCAEWAVAVSAFIDDISLSAVLIALIHNCESSTTTSMRCYARQVIDGLPMDTVCSNIQCHVFVDYGVDLFAFKADSVSDKSDNLSMCMV